MVKIRTYGVLLTALFLVSGVRATTTVVGFDDLPLAISGARDVPDSYGGIDWWRNGDNEPRYFNEYHYPEYGAAVPDADPTDDQYLYNNLGDALEEPISFVFQDPDSRLLGAYFCKGAQTNPNNDIVHVRFVGYNALGTAIACSEFLDISDTITPVWLAAGTDFQQPLARITIDRDMTGFGKFCMDNLIYNIVPEPATLVLLSLGGIVLTRKR
ncbi:MAG: PEP-CTERM sorting domain-containing protein [Sedimentisphaerales bacterium]|nr:PEP-CTERM sorting domain-containing protein [Sedimentisphaerales bacterium]